GLPLASGTPRARARHVPEVCRGRAPPSRQKPGTCGLVRDGTEGVGSARASKEAPMREITHDDKILYALSVMPGMVDADSGPDLEGQLYQQIQDTLASDSPYIGAWKIAWGPGLLQFGGRLSNGLVVFRSEAHPSRYVIAIAGTNPYSFFDWIVEDGLVSIQLPWVYGLVSAPDAKISFGTATGLVVLQTMKPTGDRPGAGTTL